MKEGTKKRERDAQDFHFQTKVSGSRSLKYPEITSVSTFKHLLSKTRGICDNYSEEKQHLLHQQLSLSNIKSSLELLNSLSAAVVMVNNSKYYFCKFSHDAFSP